MKRRMMLLIAAMGASLVLATEVALAAATQTFTNPATITINDSDTEPTPATPYPSPITVSGVSGQVRDVNVILGGFTHTFPDDVDILLQGPQGEKARIMSDAGGNCDVTDLTIKLNDEARRALPDNRCLGSRSYRPKNWQGGAGTDDFPPPAPSEPYAEKLNVFDGTDPNGTWNLYVVDDAVEDAGEILRGWVLEIKAG